MRKERSAKKVVRHVPERRLVWLADLKLDAPFRRPISRSWVKRLVKEYGIMPFPDLEVSHRENGELVLLAGHHRKEAAEELGITELWARVYTNLSLREEAQIFDTEANQRPLSPYDRHLNAIQTGDPDALAIQNALLAAGVALSRAGNGSRELSAVNAIYRVYNWGKRAGKPDVLRVSVEVLVDWCTAYETTPSGDFLTAIGWLLTHTDGEVKLARLRKVLAGIPPDHVRGQAMALSRTSRPGSTQWPNWARVLLSHYNKRLSSSALRLVENDAA